MLFEHRLINPALVLRLIRDGKAQTISTLVTEVVPGRGGSDHSYGRHSLVQTLDLLTATGFIKISKRGVLSCTPLVGKVQKALGISLRDLSVVTPNSVVAQPFFGKPEISTDKPDIFVLMPFREDLKPVYEDHIKKISRKLKLKVARADDLFGTEAVMGDIWNAIAACRIVIADCTGKNANVFYEIGIAHTLGRPTILISQGIDDVPFDLRHVRCINYENTPRGMTKFNATLLATLEREKGRIT